MTHRKTSSPRHEGPAWRSPRWLLAGGGVLLAGAVAGAVALVRRKPAPVDPLEVLREAGYGPGTVKTGGSSGPTPGEVVQGVKVGVDAAKSVAETGSTIADLAKAI